MQSGPSQAAFRAPVIDQPVATFLVLDTEQAACDRRIFTAQNFFCLEKCDHASTVQTAQQLREVAWLNHVARSNAFDRFVLFQDAPCYETLLAVGQSALPRDQ